MQEHGINTWEAAQQLTGPPPVWAAGEDEPAGANESLEDAAEDERNYLRERLRGELNREPTEEELNDYLRRHTEGY